MKSQVEKIQQDFELALRGKVKPGGGKYTIKELAELTNRPESFVRGALRALLKEGEWDVAREPRRTMIRTIQSVPVYWPKARRAKQ